MEKQLQSKISELRDKEVVSIEMQRLCSKMEKQLVQQVNLEKQRRSFLLGQSMCDIKMEQFFNRFMRSLSSSKYMTELII